MAQKGELLTKKHGDLIYDFLKSGIHDETISKLCYLHTGYKDVCIHVDDF